MNFSRYVLELSMTRKRLVLQYAALMASLQQNN
jgi:hypothetical protein